MRNLITNIKNIALFAGIQENDLTNMLSCLNATAAHYRKGDYILMAGEETNDVGIVIFGEATEYKDDILGNRSVISLIHPANLFAEIFICAGMTVSPVTVEASAETDILWLSFNKIMTTCSTCCVFHNTLIKNMLGIIAKKNLALNEKIDHIAKKTTRQKLASYLIGQATLKNSNRFTISLDRQKLADYLCVNRSALSRELSKISSEGILSYNKNRFIIHHVDQLEEILLTE
ncbi:MAG: Crp/Fnr family transcriptional regulator [Christensenellales bacterium]|jgi:CRP-like cAMP-binding protein